MTKHNNFDFLRFLFAIFVVISHSYPLSGIDESSQWIYQITNGQTVLARIGLYGFFIISGFFIFKSLERSKSLLDYYKKRFLRLFPALFFVLLITLILAPLVYQGTIPFYKNQEVYTYLPNNLSLYNFQAVIEGIFDNNPYHSINGSLWTIRYEFSLYIGLSLLYFFRKDSRIAKVLLVVCLAILLIIINFFMGRFAGSSVLGMIGYEILDLGTFFVFGSVMAALGFEKLKHRWLFLISILVLVLSIHYNFFNAVKHVVLPVIVLIIGFAPLPFFSAFGKIGDMSYGIYIYSFPVQQTLIYYYNLNLDQLMFWSLVISITLGYLSWHLIEKKALSFKNKPILKSKLFNKVI
jgi:peptidoglycan/LPS O-acetylase OafA/YrhL